MEFARLTEVIATMNNADAALELYKCFEILLERYNLPLYFSGTYRKYDFDFYKFITHELFVTFFSFLIRERRWEIIADLLEDKIYVDHNPVGLYGYSDNFVSFTYISQYVQLLEYNKNRLRLNTVLLHADILNDRHIQGDLAQIIPMHQFMDADCFLFLRSDFQATKANQPETWKPWSNVYMHEVPRYLLETSRTKYAEQLLRPLGLNNIEIFKKRLSDASTKLEKMFYNGWLYSSPLKNFDPLTIASR
jgi:hypothetical protein